MSQSLYYTAILKYRPSYLLDERVNIGILFWFLEERKLVFKYPDNLTRLQYLYFDAPLEIILRYLHTLEEQADSLTKLHPDKIHHFDKNLLQEHFLVKDANSFILGEWQLGILTVKEDVNTIIERETKKYLRYYDIAV